MKKLSLEIKTEEKTQQIIMSGELNGHAALDFRQKITIQKVTVEDCKAIMKIIIRVGFELIIEKEQQFTPDLYLCYKTFSKYYPTKETQMRQALDYFLNPITDLKTLEIFINQFGNWLENQLQNH